MKFYMNTVGLVSTAFFLIACANNDKDKSTRNINKDIAVSGVPHVESLGIGTQIHTKISLGEEPRDVYVLLSNYDKADSTVEIKKSLKKSENIDPKGITKDKQSFKTFESKQPTVVHAPVEVELFRKNIAQHLKTSNDSLVQKKNINPTINYKDVAGDQKVFYLDAKGSSSTLATARRVVSSSSQYGLKTLNIWVSNDSFGAGCNKAKCVTQSMVNALAQTFLRAGGDNDIYDWVSNVYGEEWGSTTDASLIAKNNEITILLTDISNDNNIKGGVIGFFHPKDNFKISDTIKGSNERIMLYADAVVFANGVGAWSIDDFWPKEMISTLAHEFQHMIHFYQKIVRLSSEVTDTWINEMLSESTEDLIASKIRHTGSRGVDPAVGSAGNPNNTKGRYPRFNTNNRLSLTTWTGNLTNYSNVNAFGAFLMRNYGGAKLLHDIMHVKYPNEQAIVHAVRQTPGGSGKTFNDLLREWGVAVLLSDANHLSVNLPRYNTGGYIPSQYNQSVYQLGSINFFNYNPKPSVSSASGTVARQGNYYYKVGTGLKGDVQIDIKLSGQTEATIIVK